MTLGTELGISVGPLGRGAGSDLRAGKGGLAAAFAYAHSRGLFVGVSIEAGVVASRPDVNEAFYGEVPTAVRDLQRYETYNGMRSNTVRDLVRLGQGGYRTRVFGGREGGRERLEKVDSGTSGQ